MEGITEYRLVTNETYLVNNVHPTDSESRNHGTLLDVPRRWETVMVALQQSVGPFTIEQLFIGVVGLAAIVFGLWLVYSGAKNLKRAYAIWSNDPVDAGSLHVEEGVVEAEGTAEPIDEVASAEYTGTDCLAYTYEKERTKERADLDEGTETEWHTVDSGSGSVPFYVSDDTGQAAVDPEGATFSLKPTRVDSGAKTRKYEALLEPGDNVHVFGQKQQAATEGGTLADERAFIGNGSGDSTFTVSGGTENRTIARFFAKGAGQFLFGVLVFGTLVFFALQSQIDVPLLGSLA